MQTSTIPPYEPPMRPLSPSQEEDDLRKLLASIPEKNLTSALDFNPVTHSNFFYALDNNDIAQALDIVSKKTTSFQDLGQVLSHFLHGIHSHKEKAQNFIKQVVESTEEICFAVIQALNTINSFDSACFYVDDSTHLLHHIKNHAQKKMETIELLIKNQKDINAPATSDGQTQLHLVIDTEDNAALVTLFLRYGADIHKKNFSGEDALCFATRMNAQNIVQLLLSHGAQVHSRILWETVSHSRANMLELFIQHGVDMKVIINRGTLLHSIFEYYPYFIDIHPQEDMIKTLELLLKQGINPNQPRQEGPWEERTPLHSVVYFRYGTKAADLLLQYGADINKITHTGKTALDIAIEKNYTEMISFLTSKGAKSTTASK